MADLILFFFGSFVALLFSFSLVDGIPYFVAVWLFSIFWTISQGAALMPDFVRSIWFTFFFGMLLGRVLFPAIYSPLFKISCSKSPYSMQQGGRYLSSTSIKTGVIYAFIILFLLNLLLSLTGLGQNSEFSESVNAGSKSIVPYVISGVSNSLLTYWSLSIITLERTILLQSYRRFINSCLMLPSILNVINALTFAGHLLSYATKFISPFLSYLSLRFYVTLAWFNIRSILRNLKLNKVFLIIGLSVFSILSISILLFSTVNVDIPGLITYKIINRSEVYLLLSQEKLSLLSDEYGGSILYLFHPFLRVLGLKAYDLPMGSYLIAGSNINQIGGPNVHLPIALYIIGFRGVFGYLLIFFVGLIVAFVLLSSRNKILKRIALADREPIFWAFFVYQSFSRLLIEPSAFGHMLFFNCISYFVVLKFQPSFLQVLKPVKS